MRPGPWRSVLKRDGYAVMAGECYLLHIDGILHRNEQRDLARVIATVPDLMALLADVEDYFGDRPQSDFHALSLHARMTKIMNTADIPLRSAV
jgi:hypothetical protein